MWDLSSSDDTGTHRTVKVKVESIIPVDKLQGCVDVVKVLPTPPNHLKLSPPVKRPHVLAALISCIRCWIVMETTIYPEQLRELHWLLDLGSISSIFSELVSSQQNNIEIH